MGRAEHSDSVFRTNANLSSLLLVLVRKMEVNPHQQHVWVEEAIRTKFQYKVYLMHLFLFSLWKLVLHHFICRQALQPCQSIQKIILLFTEYFDQKLTCSGLWFQNSADLLLIAPFGQKKPSQGTQQ